MASVMTVTGPVAARDLGFTLVHEHIFLDLTRDVSGRNSLLNDPELAYRELSLYKKAGGVTLVDQTTGGLRGHDHDITPTKHALAIREIAGASASRSSWAPGGTASRTTSGASGAPRPTRSPRSSSAT